ncbi:MAG: VOC family protein [Polyangiaceae bacterium]
MPSRFVRHAHRATPLDPAASFYRAVLGERFTRGLEDGSLALAPLPERARAAGAPPHWVSLIAVDDVEAITSRLTRDGATALGPTGDARRGVVLRDPWGALFGVAPSDEAPRGASDLVGWHHLNTVDLDAAVAFYGGAFGWTTRSREQRIGPVGVREPFVTMSWEQGSPAPAVSLSPSVRLPFVHPSWWPFFRVDDRERACARVRELGGNVIDVVETAHGPWVVPCEDDRGGAFGLVADA